MMPKNSKEQWGFIVFAIGSLIAYLGLVAVDWINGTLRDEFVTLTISYYLLAFFFFIVVVVWGEKRPLSLRRVWFFAVLFRALLLFTTPTLSDDVYRYIWDGYVANEGISPYALPIDSPELDYLDIPQRALANNTWMASPYMPVAQWVFWGLAFVFPLHPFFFQLLMVLFDLLSGWLILQLLILGNFPKQRVILYLLNPFVIVEVAHGAHIDAWMICLFLAAFWVTFRSEQSAKTIWSPVLMAGSTLTKIIPVLATPIFFWRWSWPQRLLYGGLTLVMLVPAGIRAGWGLSDELNGRGLFGALRIYADVWAFNSGLFKWIVLYFEQNGAVDPVGFAKRTSLILIILVLIGVWLAARRVDSVCGLLRLTAVPLIAYILLTPTVQPWYTLIVVALLPFFPPTLQEQNKFGWIAVAAWLYLNATLIFSYLTYRDPLNFGELVWVGQVEWIPTLALLALFLAFQLRHAINQRYERR